MTGHGFLTARHRPRGAALYGRALWLSGGEGLGGRSGRGGGWCGGWGGGDGGGGGGDGVVSDDVGGFVSDGLDGGGEGDVEVHEVAYEDGEKEEAASGHVLEANRHSGRADLMSVCHRGSGTANALGHGSSQPPRLDGEGMGVDGAVVAPRSILSRLMRKKARMEPTTTTALGGRVLQKRGRKSIQKAKRRKDALANANFYEVFETYGERALSDTASVEALRAELAAVEASYEAALKSPETAVLEKAEGPVLTYLGPAGMWSRIQELKERIARVTSFDDYLLSHAGHLYGYNEELERLGAEYVLRDVGEDAARLRVMDVVPAPDPSAHEPEPENALASHPHEDGELVDDCDPEPELIEDGDREHDTTPPIPDDGDGEEVPSVTPAITLGSGGALVHVVLALLSANGALVAVSPVLSPSESTTAGMLLTFARTAPGLFPGEAAATYGLGVARRPKGKHLHLLDGNGVGIGKQATLAGLADRALAGTSREMPLALGLCPEPVLTGVRLRVPRGTPIGTTASRLGAIMSDFLVAVTGERPDGPRATDGGKCSRCGSSTVRDAAASEMVCTNSSCATAMSYFENTRAHMNYEDRPIMPHTNETRTNKRRNFIQILNESQGKESAVIPEDLLAKLRERIVRYKFTPSQLTEACMKDMLRELDRDTYYRHIPKIRALLTGIPPRTLTPDQETQLIADYERLQEPFERFSKNKRQNMFFFKYVFPKLCEKNGYVEFLQDYTKYMKSTDNLTKNDALFRQMFEYLGWPWKASI